MADIFSMLMVFAGFGFIGIIVLLFMLKKKKTLIVEYSEIVGNKIIHHHKMYVGLLDHKNDIMMVKKINLKYPIPPRKVLIPLNNGKKGVCVIKIDENRYAYRIPTLTNEVIVEDRDDKGNKILKNGKPVLKRLNWVFADNFYEPEITHWAEAEIIKSEQRHKEKMNFWEKFGVPIGIMVLFLMGLIGFNMQSKSAEKLMDMYKSDKEELFKEARQVQSDAQKTQAGLNALLEKITGEKVFQEENNRESYYNSTKT